jgi:hypothetical protein
MFTNQQQVYGSCFDANSSLLAYPVVSSNQPCYGTTFPQTSNLLPKPFMTNFSNGYNDRNSSTSTSPRSNKDKKWILYSNLMSDGSSSLRSSHSSIVTMISNGPNLHDIKSIDRAPSNLDDSRIYLTRSDRALPSYWQPKTSKHYDHIYMTKTPTPSETLALDSNSDPDKFRRSFRYASYKTLADNKPFVLKPTMTTETTNLFRKCSLPPERTQILQITRPYVQQPLNQNHSNAYDQQFAPKQGQLKTSGEHSAFKQVLKKDESKQLAIQQSQPLTEVEQPTQFTADFTPQLIKTFQNRTSSYLKRKPSTLTIKPHANRSISEQSVKPRIYANRSSSRNLNDITTSSLNDSKQVKISTPTVFKKLTDLNTKYQKIDHASSSADNSGTRTSKFYSAKLSTDLYMKENDVMKFEFHDENIFSVSERNVDKISPIKKYNTLLRKKKVFDLFPMCGPRCKSMVF